MEVPTLKKIGRKWCVTRSCSSNLLKLNGLEEIGVQEGRQKIGCTLDPRRIGEKGVDWMMMMMTFGSNKIRKNKKKRKERARLETDVGALIRFSALNR